MPNHHKFRSYICRERTFSLHVQNIYDKLWAKFGRPYFEQNGKLILEIGFGSGEVLLKEAKAHPTINFLGIEVYRHGILKLMLALDEENINNVRIYNSDCLDILQNHLPEDSLDEIRLFFPDPWPKRRHHQRRLVQPSFIDLIGTKLQNAGAFYFVTDWEDYAIYVEKIMREKNNFMRVNSGDFSVETSKFGRKGINAGRNIYQLKYAKVDGRFTNL